jgi:uncharacterized protein
MRTVSLPPEAAARAAALGADRVVLRAGARTAPGAVAAAGAAAVEASARLPAARLAALAEAAPLDLRLDDAPVGRLAAALGALRGRPVRVLADAARADLPRVLNVATALGVPCVVGWERPGTEDAAAVAAALRGFFHGPLTNVAVEPWAAMVRALGDGARLTLREHVHPRPEAFLYVGRRGLVTDGPAGAAAGRAYGRIDDGLARLLASPHARALAAAEERLFAEPTPCATCWAYEVCGGLYALDGIDCEASRPHLERLQAELSALRRAAAGRARPPRPRRVTTASVFVARTCVNDCLFCAPAARRRAGGPPLEVARLIDEAAARGARALTLSGAGEPLLAPELAAWVARARAAGIGEVTVFTNGHGLTDARRDELVAAGVTGFLVSLHGGAATHDALVRRRGSHAEATAALGRVTGRGLAVTVNSCLMRRNLGELAALCRDVAAHGTVQHTLSVPEWSGNALAHEDELATYAEIDAALRRLPDDVAPALVNCPACVGPPRLRRIAPAWAALNEGAGWRDVNPRFTHNVFPPACAGCPERDGCCGLDRGAVARRGADEIAALAPRPAWAPRRAAPKLVFMPTAECNLDCAYCFVPHAPGRMSLARVAAVARAYAAEAGAGEADVYWQGGEILLCGRDWVERAAGLFDAAFAAAGGRARHHLQTNLVGYGPVWDDLFRRVFGGRVSTSCDHPNLGRRLPGGDAAGFERAFVARYRALRAAGFTGPTLAVLNAASVARGARAFLRFFYDELGVQNLQVNLPFPPPGRADGALRAAAESGALGAFLAELHAEWRRSYRDRGHDLAPLAALERFFASGGATRALPCTFAPDCTSAIVAVGPRGQVGLCDCWLHGYPEHAYGRLGRGGLGPRLRSRARARLAGRLGALVEGPCGGCPFLAACFGGCPLRAVAFGGAPEERDPYCPAYQALFRAVAAPRGGDRPAPASHEERPCVPA